MIKETVIFDVGNSVASLNALYTAINNVNAALKGLASGAKTAGLGGASTQAGKLAANANKAAVAMKNAGNQSATAARKAASAGKSMTISWETFIRVIQTQLILRAFSSITKAIGEAADEFGKFQIEVARMAQITPEGSAGISKLTSDLESISVKTGRTIDEVSGAAFEALQNDLGTTAETMDLLGGAAANLALVTDSDLTSAINSISSVLKSYNLDISESADIADTFFVAIDKGRITLDQLESRLGTVAPQTAALGISFKDMASAAASLTLSGLNSQTSMTQLRNIFAKMIKPTEDLEEAFGRLGVSSGNELVAKFGGLQGAMAALKAAFGGNEQAVARAFGTIRGQLGVLNLLANEGTNYNHVLEAMEDRAGRAAKAAGEINKVTQRDIDKEMQRLNKTLRRVGESFNLVKLSALKFFNTVSGAGNFEKINQKRVDAIQQSNDNIKNALKKSSSDIRKSIESDIAVIKNVLGEAAGQEAMVMATVYGDIKIAQKQVNAHLVQINSLINANIIAQKEFAREAALAVAPGLLDADPEAIKVAREFVQQMTFGLNKISEASRTAGASQTEQLQKMITSRKESLDAALKAGIFDERTAQALIGQVDAVNQLILAREKQLGLQKDQLKVNNILKEAENDLHTSIQENIGDLNQVLPEAAKNSAQSIKDIPDPVVNTASAIRNLKALQQQALATAQAVASANSGGGTGLYHGGQVNYHADGGPARGMDRYPAMLAKNEFVVNSRSSRQFFSQLQAMNAGQAPAYREQGGSVTNIGDINVNVTSQGTDSPEQFARVVAGDLRRELRRKTSKL